MSNPSADRTITFHRDFRTEPSLAGLARQMAWGPDTVINQELQRYEDETPFAFTAEGLSIGARQTPDGATHSQSYESGVITGNGPTPFGQQYGRWAIRAKLPDAVGAWPAFWLLPMNWEALKKEHPGEDTLSEIDIMEAVARVTEGIYHATFHTRDGHGSTLTASGAAIKTDFDLTGEFHEYALEWTAESLVWLLDGHEARRAPTPADMHDVRHFLVNLAIGGTWGETPDPADYPASLVVESITVLAPLDNPTAPPGRDAATAVALASAIRHAKWMHREGAAKEGLDPAGFDAVISLLENAR